MGNQTQITKNPFIAELKKDFQLLIKTTDQNQKSLHLSVDEIKGNMIRFHLLSETAGKTTSKDSKRLFEGTLAGKSQLDIRELRYDEYSKTYIPMNVRTVAGKSRPFSFNEVEIYDSKGIRIWQNGSRVQQENPAEKPPAPKKEELKKEAPVKKTAPAKTHEKVQKPTTPTAVEETIRQAKVRGEEKLPEKKEIQKPPVEKPREAKKPEEKKVEVPASPKKSAPATKKAVPTQVQEQELDRSESYKKMTLAEMLQALRAKPAELLAESKTGHQGFQVFALGQALSAEDRKRLAAFQILCGKLAASHALKGLDESSIYINALDINATGKFDDATQQAVRFLQDLLVKYLDKMNVKNGDEIGLLGEKKIILRTSGLANGKLGAQTITALFRFMSEQEAKARELQAKPEAKKAALDIAKEIEVIAEMPLNARKNANLFSLAPPVSQPEQKIEAPVQNDIDRFNGHDLMTQLDIIARSEKSAIKGKRRLLTLLFTRRNPINSNGTINTNNVDVSATLSELSRRAEKEKHVVIDFGGKRCKITVEGTTLKAVPID